MTSNISVPLFTLVTLLGMPFLLIKIKIILQGQLKYHLFCEDLNSPQRSVHCFLLYAPTTLFESLLIYVSFYYAFIASVPNNL